MLKQRREAKMADNYSFAPFWQPISTFSRKEQTRSILNKCSLFCESGLSKKEAGLFHYFPHTISWPQLLQPKIFIYSDLINPSLTEQLNSPNSWAHSGNSGLLITEVIFNQAPHSLSYSVSKLILSFTLCHRPPSKGQTCRWA